MVNIFCWHFLPRYVHGTYGGVKVEQCYHSSFQFPKLFTVTFCAKMMVRRDPGASASIHNAI